MYLFSAQFLSKLKMILKKIKQGLKTGRVPAVSWKALGSIHASAHAYTQ